MGKLRNDTIEFIEEFKKLSTRLGLNTDNSPLPGRKVDYEMMSQMAEDMHASVASVSFSAEAFGETSIPVEVQIVGPTDQSLPQARHFTRMVEQIMRAAGGVDNMKKSSLGSSVYDRKLTFDMTDETAAALKRGMREINEYLDANKGQEQAVYAMLQNAAAIENTYTDRQHFTTGAKVEPSFTVRRVKDPMSGETVPQPVFGVRIQVKNDELMGKVNRVKASTPGISNSESTSFDFVEDRHRRQLVGKRVVAEGEAMEKLVEALVGKDKSVAPPPPPPGKHSSRVRDDSDDSDIGLRSFVPPRQ